MEEHLSTHRDPLSNLGPISNDFEREPLRYCECDEKVTFTRPFLMNR